MVLAIGAGETQATAATWRSTYGLTHPVLADPTAAVYSSFGAGFVPHNSIIDGNVILQYTEIGYDQPAVIATIEHLLLNIDHAPMLDSEDDLNPYPVDCSINSAWKRRFVFGTRDDRPSRRRGSCPASIRCYASTGKSPTPSRSPSRRSSSGRSKRPSRARTR